MSSEPQQDRSTTDPVAACRVWTRRRARSTGKPFPQSPTRWVTCAPGPRPAGSSPQRKIRSKAMCEVLNKHHAGVPAGAVYVGRGGKWGNPFRTGRDGDRATVIAKYERWLADQRHLLR